MTPLLQTFSYSLGFGGETSVLEALASFFNTYFDPSVPVLPQHIVTAPGASSCLDALLYNICDAGDSVLVLGPYWSKFHGSALFGFPRSTLPVCSCLCFCFFEIKKEKPGIPLGPGRSNPISDGFDIHFRIRANVNIIAVNTPAFPLSLTPAILATLESTYSSAPDPTRIKALVLTNPHNPFAICYPLPVLRRCMSFCHTRGLHFVSDEVYALSNFTSGQESSSSISVDTQLAAPFVSALALEKLSSVRKEENEEEAVEQHEIDRSRTHVVWSMSKDFGCSGIRMVCSMTSSFFSLPLSYFATAIPRVSTDLLRMNRQCGCVSRSHFEQGCLISQANLPLRTGMALLTTTQTSCLSSILTTALLTSPKLPALLAVNSRRMSASYAIVTSILRQWDVEFIPASAGLFVFARLVKGAQTWEEETAVVERLRNDAGVLVSPGRAYHGVEGEKGWVRLTFAVPALLLTEGLRRMGRCLGLDEVDMVKVGQQPASFQHQTKG